jgi:micrococcal nuclease
MGRTPTRGRTGGRVADGPGSRTIVIDGAEVTIAAYAAAGVVHDKVRRLSRREGRSMEEAAIIVGAKDAEMGRVLSSEALGVLAVADAYRAGAQLFERVQPMASVAQPRPKRQAKALHGEQMVMVFPAAEPPPPERPEPNPLTPDEILRDARYEVEVIDQIARVYPLIPVAPPVGRTRHVWRRLRGVADAFPLVLFMVLFVAVCVTLGLVVGDWFDGGLDDVHDGTAAGGQASVARVIDGDTIEVRQGSVLGTVRLIGINTPETVDPHSPVECFGPEASERTKALLPEGTQVRLVADVEARDRYGRLLAYVYRLDGLFVNRSLVEDGYAYVATYRPNVAHVDEFIAANAEARDGARGLWGACGGSAG